MDSGTCRTCPTRAVQLWLPKAEAPPPASPPQSRNACYQRTNESAYFSSLLKSHRAPGNAEHDVALLLPISGSTSISDTIHVTSLRRFALSRAPATTRLSQPFAVDNAASSPQRTEQEQ